MKQYFSRVACALMLWGAVLPTATLAGQSTETRPALGQLEWQKLNLDSLPRYLLRAVLTPPIRNDSPYLDVARNDLLGDEVYFVIGSVNWGTGLIHSAYFAVAPSLNYPPIILWSGLDSYNFYDNDGTLQSRWRACLYSVDDSTIAYAAIRTGGRDKTPPTGPGHPAASGYYRYRVGLEKRHALTWVKGADQRLMNSCRDQIKLSQ